MFGIKLTLLFLVICLLLNKVYSFEVGKIKHVIVLMLENRSFDHLLGNS
jgi:phospholipase C